MGNKGFHGFSGIKNFLSEIIRKSASVSAPADTDKFGFLQITSGFIKSITWANIKATLKTYFDTLYTPIGGREVLTANRTYYVRTDGNDANDGLTNSSGGAFLTAGKANNVVATIDKNGYDITVQFGAGTWAEDIIINTGIGDGAVKWKGTLTLLESVTSATVSAGSGATAGTVTKTGQFTGNNYSAKLLYFVTDAVYRIIYSNTNDVLTLADIAASSTTQNVDVYTWGTLINSITLTKPDVAVTLEFLQVANNSSPNYSFSVELYPYTQIEIIDCYIGKIFVVGGGLTQALDSVFYSAATSDHPSVAYNGTGVLRRCLGIGKNTSSTIFVISRGGYMLIQGGTFDGDDAIGGKATYGFRAYGSASLQFNAAGYGNVKIRNCDIGVHSEQTSSVIGTSAITFTNCTTNKSATAASYGYMD